MRGKLVFLIGFIVFSLIICQDAKAYIDPGTGSYIFQLIICFFMGSLFAIKMFWGKINIYLKNLFSQRKKSEKDSK